MIVLILIMQVLYQTNSLGEKMYRSPSKIKSESYSNVATIHFSLLKLQPVITIQKYMQY